MSNLSEAGNESINDITIQIPTKNESGEIEPIKERKKLTHQEVAIMLDKYEQKNLWLSKN